jgi:hypothetical protein
MEIAAMITTLDFLCNLSINELPNKPECYITLVGKGLTGTNTLPHLALS